MFEEYNRRNLPAFAKKINELKDGEIDYVKNIRNETILEVICSQCNPGDEHFLEIILRRGANPNSLTSSKYHVLSFFANNQYKNIKMFELLLNYGANVNYCIEHGKNLHDMCINGDCGPNYVEAIQLALRFGAKNCYLQKHYSLGNMSTIQVCQMLISPNCNTHGFRSSQNIGITQHIIHILNSHVYVPISYLNTRSTKLAIIASERAIEIKNKQIEQDKLLSAERDRITQINLIESKRLSDIRNAELERNKQAQIELIRLATIERDRLAQIESDRLAQIESDRLAQIESDRLAQIERDRLAQIESDRLAQIEQDRLDNIALNDIQQTIELINTNEMENTKHMQHFAEQMSQLAVENKHDINQTEIEKNKTGLSFLALAVSNLEYLFHNNENIPENLKCMISDMTTQLLIKAGQYMTRDALDKIHIPIEYKHLIEYSDAIVAFWE